MPIQRIDECGVKSVRNETRCRRKRVMNVNSNLIRKCRVRVGVRMKVKKTTPGSRRCELPLLFALFSPSPSVCLSVPVPVAIRVDCIMRLWCNKLGLGCSFTTVPRQQQRRNQPTCAGDRSWGTLGRRWDRKEQQVHFWEHPSWLTVVGVENAMYI